MTQTIKAHYDGRVIVPDEPVHLVDNQQVTVTIHPAVPEWTPERLAAQARAVDRILASPKSAANPPDEAFRREHMY